MTIGQTSDRIDVDVAIIGSGFVGSIIARLLAKKGRHVALIDRFGHPRFAIGESSTPAADAMLRLLADHYDEPLLRELSAWGSLRRSHPKLRCGPKRGFTYHDHRGVELGRGDSMLVAASASDEVSDTHWCRADVDHLLFRHAIDAGVEDWTGWSIQSLQSEPFRHGRTSRCVAPFMTLTDQTGGSPQRMTARHVIDASGRSAVTAKLLNAKSYVGRMRTQTYAKFTHMTGVCCDLIPDHPGDPYPADAAAVHHLIGQRTWMWNLHLFDPSGLSASDELSDRSDDQTITSVGVVSDRPVVRMDENIIVQRLLGGARLANVPGRWIDAGRVQHWTSPITGPNVWSTPTAAAVIDPLHSTGIAHGLIGVAKLIQIVLQSDRGTNRQSDLIASYSDTLMREVQYLDRIVAATYRCMPDFTKFADACGLYLLSAIAFEEHLTNGTIDLDQPLRPAFGLHHRPLAECVTRWCEEIAKDDGWSEKGNRRRSQMISELEPYNEAGMFHRSDRRYAYTATKK